MILPDVIAPNLRVVFCGTAVGAASARRRAYYAGPGNKFWPTLHEIGITPRLVQPGDYASVIEYGIGLTDLSKRQSGSDFDIGTHGFDVDRLATLVQENTPQVIAFNGVKAGRTALGSFDGCGRQACDFAGSEAWILPSTSGAASRWWNPNHWRDLGRRLR